MRWNGSMGEGAMEMKAYLYGRTAQRQVFKEEAEVSLVRTGRSATATVFVGGSRYVERRG